METLFPMFVKLTGRTCLVVGAGYIAESKLANLLITGTQLRVVAPEATSQIRQWSDEGRLHWQKKVFEPCDLDDVFLVVACTFSPDLNRNIFDAAQRRGVLCNVVDVSELCDFYYPAVVRRGELQIAISTSGQSPALARRLREELEVQFGPEYEPLVQQLGTIRKHLFSTNLQPEARKQLLHGLASRHSSGELLEKFGQGAAPAG